MNPDALGVMLARLSTGGWLCETVDLVGALSPWQILMERCRTEGMYLTDLRLRVGQWVMETRPNAPGYFHATRLFRSLALHGESGDVGYKGIGWVGEDRRALYIIWASTRLLARCCATGPLGLMPGCGFVRSIEHPLAPRPCEQCAGGRVHTVPDAWRETRPVHGNQNLIWAPGSGGSSC